MTDQRPTQLSYTDIRQKAPGFVSNIYEHFAWVQLWLEVHDAQGVLDVKDFSLHIHHKNQKISFVPRFFNMGPGQRKWYARSIGPHTTGFIGWIPHKPIRFDLSDSKKQFKDLLQRQGFKTPRLHSSQDIGNIIDFPHILKADNASFGEAIRGPFAAGQCPGSMPNSLQVSDSLLVEEFVYGEIIKIWVLPSGPFFAHRHGYPNIVGDRQQTVAQLLAERFTAAGDPFLLSSARDTVLQCLRYQSIGLSDILKAGQSVWIDFRYGHFHALSATYKRSPVHQKEYETRYSFANALPQFSGSQLEAINAVCSLCTEHLFKQYGSKPNLYALDAILDAKGEFHWLEINSNPSLPPCGYAIMFDQIFGVTTPMTPEAQAA